MTVVLTYFAFGLLWQGFSWYAAQKWPGFVPPFSWQACLKEIAFIVFSAGLLFLILAKRTKAIKRNPANLLDDEGVLALAIQGSEEAFWAWNAEKNEFWYSPRAVEILGFAPPVTGMTWADWDQRLNADDGQRARTIIEKHLIGYTEQFECECRVRLTSGGWSWVLVRGKVIERDGFNKQPVRAAGTLMDISRRKATDEALRHSEIRFRTFVEQANDILFSLTPDAICRYVSPNWTPRLGYQTGDVLERSFSGFVHSDDFEGFQRFLGKILRGQKPPPVELRLRHSSGAWLWHSADGSIVLGFEGQPAVFCGIAREITEQRRAQMEILRQLVFQQTVIDAIPLPVFYKDTSGHYIGVNRAMEKFFLRERGDILGKTAAELVPAHIAEGYRADDVELLRRRGEAVVESIAVDGHGRLRDVVSYKATFNGPDGEVAGLVGVALDNTDRKHFERELERQNARNEALFNSAHDGFHVLNESGRIVRVNDAFCRMLGYSSDELAGMTAADWDAHWKPNELGQIIRDLAQRSAVFETQYRRRDGSIIDVEVSATGVRIEGQMLLFGAARDVTERKRRETR